MEPVGCIVAGNVRSARGSHSIQLQLTNSAQFQVIDNKTIIGGGIWFGGAKGEV